MQTFVSILDVYVSIKHLNICVVVIIRLTSKKITKLQGVNMGWLGALAGGTVGFLVGGPIGAAAGAAAGGAVGEAFDDDVSSTSTPSYTSENKTSKARSIRNKHRKEEVVKLIIFNRESACKKLQKQLNAKRKDKFGNFSISYNTKTNEILLDSAQTNDGLKMLDDMRKLFLKSQGSSNKQVKADDIHKESFKKYRVKLNLVSKLTPQILRCATSKYGKENGIDATGEYIKEKDTYIHELDIIRNNLVSHFNDKSKSTNQNI